MEITVVLTVGGEPYVWTGDHDLVTNEVEAQAAGYVQADFDTQEGQDQMARLMDEYGMSLTPETAKALKVSDDPEARFLAEYPTWTGDLFLL